MLDVDVHLETIQMKIKMMEIIDMARILTFDSNAQQYEYANMNINIIIM